MLTLAKLTGWGLEEIMGLSFEEAEMWLEDAVEVHNTFAEKGV